MNSVFQMKNTQPKAAQRALPIFRRRTFGTISVIVSQFKVAVGSFTTQGCLDGSFAEVSMGQMTKNIRTMSSTPRLNLRRIFVAV